MSARELLGADRETRPWRGVLVANPVIFDADLNVDFDAYGEHVAWLAASGCDGITPNGSLGEYQSLTREERELVIKVAMEAAPDGFDVIPAVSSYDAADAVRWTVQAQEAGAKAVMALPPNSYRANEAGVVEHFRQIAAVGLPVIAYNNPFDTKVDLTAKLLARLHGEGLIVAVKEFAGDPRRAYATLELSPELDVLIGSDDTVLEIALAGGVGWVSGFPSAFPHSCVELYRAAIAGELDVAVPLYRALHPLLRWDSRTEFVQAIKLSMDIVGRRGGPCRSPRVPLTEDEDAEVRSLTETLAAAGMS